MAVNSKYKPELRWDKSGFEKLKSTWSPERIAGDGKDLRKLFAELAEDSPLVAEALAWAERHGVEFFIDRQVENSKGYYTLGTGVLALIPSVLWDPARAANVLVHEIRHAWQDYYGLIAWDDKSPDNGNFTDFFINDALIEADAYAFGCLAEKQVSLSKQEKTLKKTRLATGRPISAQDQAFLLKQRDEIAEGNVVLGEKFQEWFEKWRPEFYGDYFSKKYGLKWGLYDGKLPARNFEFDPPEPNVRGFDIHDRQDVLRLGANFSGIKNYLATLEPKILPKQILRPSLANTFWGSASPAQRKLTTELRKAYLKKKLSPENRKPRHIWP